MLRPPLRAPVLALVDGDDGAAAREAMAAFYQPAVLDYESLVTLLVEQPGETLRSLAVFHIGELGLDGMRPRIEELRSRETSLFVGQMFDRTLGVLGAS